MTLHLKRICYVVPSLHVGGAPIQLLRLLRDLARDHELTVVCTDEGGELKREAVGLGAVVHELGLRRPWDPRTTRRLINVFRKHRPDVVHALLNGYDGFACRAAGAVGVPVIVSGRQEMADLLTPHRLRRLRQANRMTDAIIANSQAVAAAAVKCEHAPPGLLRVIPSGIDLVDLDPGARFQTPFPAGTVVVGMTANFIPVKDHALFVQMARVLADAREDIRFLLIGRGPLREKVLRQISEAGLDARFHVTQTACATVAAYRAMTRFVLTSRSEGCPNAVMEAMIAGIPVLAAGVGGVPELVADGVTGRLVHSREPQAFAEAVLESLGSSEAGAMAARAAEMIGREMTVERMGAAHRRLYAELLAHAHRKAV